MAMVETLSVCYVLSYYAPDYIRTRTLVAALRAIPGVALHEARNRSRGIWRYAETLGRLLSVQRMYAPRIYILGFRGYELFWIVRLLTLRQTLIYDHMMSPYDSLVHERKRLREGSLAARLVCAYEKGILRSADLVLTDTEPHRRFLCAAFGLPASKVLAVPVGADEDVFVRRAGVPRRRRAQDFQVLFYGSFLPLHGIGTVLGAASLLRDERIHFTMIGGSPSARRGTDRMIQRAALRNVTRLDWAEFESLPSLIVASDLGLGGPFGDTGQARRVITGKTFQFMAMACPVVIGATEVDGGFVDRVNCLLVPQANAVALAEAIRWACLHPSELREVGQRGQELYAARYSVAHISAELRSILR